jgi:hypothetical protein
MPIIIGLMIYVIFALVVANEGRGTRAGFLGTFFVSLLITPLIAYLLLTGFEEVLDVDEGDARRRPDGTA